MAKENEEIAQISFYLAKEKSDFETAIDAGIKNKNPQTFDFESNGAKCRFIYFETKSHKNNPPWLDFINQKLHPNDRRKFGAFSHSPNGILLISISGRLLAATFGRSASSYLKARTYEPDFGIKTAMNMCGNEEIRQTKTQSTAITTTHIARQVSKPSDAFVFGLSEAEDLHYISAHMKNDGNITLQGRDSLTLKINGSQKLNWARLIKHCRSFLVQYDKKDYIKLFPNYKNFRAANEDETLLLDKALIRALRAKSLDKIQLCIPDFSEDDEYSYSYTNHASRDNRVYSHLDIVQLLEEVNLNEVTIQRLHSKKIYAYSHIESRVLSHRKWSIYDCFIFEHKLGQKYFILSGGYWSEIDDQFYQAIIKFAEHSLKEEPCEEIYKNIDISDDATKKNKESIFNERAVELKSNSILFDQAKLQIGAGHKNKEFCDILDFHDDNLIRIINCKQYAGATSINYLFSQAKFYCEAFLKDETLLAGIRDHIQSSECPIKDQYLEHIKPTIEQINGRDYRICLWLLYDKKGKIPNKADLSIMSKYELKLMHDHLRRVCKFNEIVLRFIPITIKNYKTQATPKKINKNRAGK